MGATGKVFLSIPDNVGIAAFLSGKGLRRYTENSITGIDKYFEEIGKTRRLGYALDLEEYLKGIRSVAALIYRDKHHVDGWVLQPNDR